MDCRLFLLCAITATMACHASEIRVEQPDPMMILAQKKLFLIRSNPCGCIVDTPELDYEIKLGQQWIRAFIDPESSEPEIYKQLRSSFLRSPRSIQEVDAQFTGVFFRWRAGHHAPGIGVTALSGPKPPKASQEPESPD